MAAKKAAAKKATAKSSPIAPKAAEKISAAAIVEELKSLAQDSIKKVLLNHGIPEPLLGVKVEELKKIQKRVKKDYQLSLELFDTGIYDAMYLAGLIADEEQMTKKDLQNWAKNSTSEALCSYTIAWVAAESQHGWSLAMEWIESKKESIAVTGWSTLSSLVGIKEDSELDPSALRKLVERVKDKIHSAPNRVRYAMNIFLIAVGGGVQPLSEFALKAAKEIGVVTVDMGNTSCKVPYAPDYIEKIKKRGTVGKKRKTARC